MEAAARRRRRTRGGGEIPCPVIPHEDNENKKNTLQCRKRARRRRRIGFSSSGYINNCSSSTGSSSSLMSSTTTTTTSNAIIVNPCSYSIHDNTRSDCDSTAVAAIIRRSSSTRRAEQQQIITKRRRRRRNRQQRLVNNVPLISSSSSSMLNNIIKIKTSVVLILLLFGCCCCNFGSSMVVVGAQGQQQIQQQEENIVIDDVAAETAAELLVGLKSDPPSSSPTTESTFTTMQQQQPQPIPPTPSPTKNAAAIIQQTSIPTGITTATGDAVLVQTAPPTTIPPVSQPPTTKQPTKQPTKAPSKQPTRGPTKKPTHSPSNIPSDAPSLNPTTRPTTSAPSKKPTPKPSTKKPTRSPSDRPSEIPSSSPSTKSPTKSPTKNPSPAPSPQPSISNAPTTTTPEPTISPQPSPQPTIPPTGEPSDSPSDSPSSQPSPSPSRFPSPSPTHSPTLPLQENIVSVVMVLELTTGFFQYRSAWKYERVTAGHIADSIQRDKEVKATLTYLYVDTDISEQEWLPVEPDQHSETQQSNSTNSTNNNATADDNNDNLTSESDSNQRSIPKPSSSAPSTAPSTAPSGQVEQQQQGRRQLVWRWRRLDEEEVVSDIDASDNEEELDLRPLEITLGVQIDYKSDVQDYDVGLWVAGAFNNPFERELYLTSLNATGDEAFMYLTSVEVLDIDGSKPDEERTKAPTVAPTADPNDNQRMVGVYVGSVFGGVAAIGLLFAGLVLQSRRRTAREKHGSNKKVVQPSTSTEAVTKVAIQTEIVVDRQDDISTLGDPVFGGHTGGMALQHDLHRDERTASVAEADYDYARQIYPSSNTNINNNRERLLSGDSQPLVMTRNSSSQSGYSTKLGGGPMGASVFSDDCSFEQQFKHNDGGSGDKYFEQFEVRVPPGKLGMVIDTPNGGVPVVHALKSESILADTILVGDQLMSVDQEDVTAMTALQVSKLISLRSDQHRTLVFKRVCTRHSPKNVEGDGGEGLALHEKED